MSDSVTAFYATGLMRGGAAGTLVWAGLAKWRDRSSVAEQMQRHLFGQISPSFVVGLAMVEFIGAGLLLAGGLQSSATVSIFFSAPAVLLTLAFLVVLTISLVRNIDVGCGCFGADDEPLSVWSTLRAITLFLATLTALILSTTYVPTENGELRYVVNSETIGLAIIGLLALIRGNFLRARAYRQIREHELRVPVSLVSKNGPSTTGGAFVD